MDEASATSATRSPSPTLETDLQNGSTEVDLGDVHAVDDMTPSPGLHQGDALDGIGASFVRLLTTKQLTSSDISQCLNALGPRPDWHCFDPGYPLASSDMSVSRQRSDKQWPNNLLFIINDHAHWSLVHFDAVTCVLKHYNSEKSIQMNLGRVEAWALTHLGADSKAITRVEAVRFLGV